MNIIDLLMSDHREVITMIDRLESGGPQPQIFLKLKQSIELHSRGEETIFYPALKGQAATGDMVEHSYEEHAQVDQILAKMETQTNDRDGFMQSLAELRENLMHHVQEEERELFPKAEGILGQQRLDEMGRKMMLLKQQNLAA